MTTNIAIACDTEYYMCQFYSEKNFPLSKTYLPNVKAYAYLIGSPGFLHLTS
jgi:hypothetical protein